MSKQTKYKCVKSFAIDHFDEDGSRIENTHYEVKAGSVWQKDESPYRVTAGRESVRLTNSDNEWIEIYSLNEHFIKLKDD